MRLLVVEDDVRLADQLRRGFRAESYAVDCVGTAEDARWLATENDYDAVVLDIGLPEAMGTPCAPTSGRPAAGRRS